MYGQIQYTRNMWTAFSKLNKSLWVHTIIFLRGKLICLFNLYILPFSNKQFQCTVSEWEADQNVHLYPVSVAVCAKAFLRSSAILVPRHASSTSCIPQFTCWWEIGGELEFADIGEAQLTDGTPKHVLCNEAPLFGIEMLLAIVEQTSWRPLNGTCEPKDWPRGVWRGKEGVRARGFPFIDDVILGIEDQRESVGRNVQKASFMVPNGDIPGLGRRAPGVRNTLVVFFLFFHFARLFWNQTCNQMVYMNASI